jgi:4-alpha-glucanotransferase
MELVFRIHYKAPEGSVMQLFGTLMNRLEGDWWELTLPARSLKRDIPYTYTVLLPDGSSVTEQQGRSHKGLPKADKIFITDRWSDLTYSYVFSTHTARTPKKSPIHLMVQSGAVPQGYHLALCGNTKETGMWDPQHAVALTYTGGGLWTAALSSAPGSFEYKYVIRKDGHKQWAEWEEGPNRKLPVPFPIQAGSKEHQIIADHPHRSSRPGLKFAGTAIPIFSLRSENSWGIGDFEDLKLMALWAEKTGQRVIQILPVNDTTMYHNWIDSYPYGGISVMALHPLYARIENMCPEDIPVDLSRFQKERKKLNSLPELDYDGVATLKWEALKYVYKKTGKTTMQSASYLSYIKENNHWLQPYALFCVLRDTYGTADFTKWDKYKTYDPAYLADVDQEQLNLYIFVQYHLDKQLVEARDFLNSKGLVLKGDIPIGITPQSVEAWALPHLFHMQSQAGAPPDDFSVHGQNWGFPTYNWAEMEKDGYAWWKNRFSYMARYFQAYRIDHILGFFRIWTIPARHSSGLLGYFDPALPFTTEELHRNGVVLHHERMVKPYITDWVLDEIFGNRAAEVKESYLSYNDSSGRYDLKEPFDTQRKIQAHFSTLPDDELHRNIQEGLMDLCTNVLFVEQPDRADAYHPRISAQYSLSYKALDDDTQFAFNKLYDHFFYHRHNEFWYHSAMKKLPPLISATQMLCCAEDLGMIPDCVHPVMQELSMLSLEVQRMPKDTYLDFGYPAHYPYLSVCTTGTHDMSTLRGWWEEDRAVSSRFYHHFMDKQDEAPYYCEPSVCLEVIKDHLHSPAMLCILPWQDWMALSATLRREDPHAERINIPAIVPHYWQYRMHMTLEELLQEDEFNAFILNLIETAGR